MCLKLGVRDGKWLSVSCVTVLIIACDGQRLFIV